MMARVKVSRRVLEVEAWRVVERLLLERREAA